MNHLLARSFRAAPAAFLLLAFAAGGVAQTDPAKPPAEKRQAEPAPSKGSGQAPSAGSGQGDEYSGKTVKTTKDGYGLIRARGKNVPKVGQIAPDFALKTADGKKTVKLSDSRGKTPVVLVFGSFT
jgi:hypothetical protein